MFLARLARCCIKSCTSCTKNEAFLARYEKSCKDLAKNCKIIFLQDFDSNLARRLSYNFFLQGFCNCKIFLHLARNSSFLVQDLQDMCKIYCKILQCKSCKKNTCKICIFLAQLRSYSYVATNLIGTKNSYLQLFTQVAISMLAFWMHGCISLLLYL